MTTRYLDVNGYKRGKGQVTSQIESRWQYGQRGQKSCTTSTLTLRNGEAVTHHFTQMERQLLIISAMIERVRSRWGLPVPVMRQRRHR